MREAPDSRKRRHYAHERERDAGKERWEERRRQRVGSNPTSSAIAEKSQIRSARTLHRYRFFLEDGALWTSSIPSSTKRMRRSRRSAPRACLKAFLLVENAALIASGVL